MPLVKEMLLSRARRPITPTAYRVITTCVAPAVSHVPRQHHQLQQPGSTALSRLDPRMAEGGRTPSAGVRCFAKPSSKLPSQSVSISCAACHAMLYKYRKNGKGKLVKCYVERITQDWTQGDLKCHECGVQFARHAIVHGKPAHKIIGGKVIVKK